MTTIKGGVTIKKGEKLPKELLKRVKLPFTATGWESDENADIVRGE